MGKKNSKRTKDMATPSPDPVQETNDTEEIPLQDQVQTAVTLQDWTSLTNVLRKGKNSEMSEILKNKEYVEQLLRNILENGRLDIVFLLEKVHKVDMTQFIKTDGTECTILCHAVKGGHLYCVNYLLKKGADVNQHCESHQSPLTQACAVGEMNIVVKFIDKGACVDGSSQSTRTPLMAAVSDENIDIVRCLLQNEANPNVQTVNGETALHEAVLCGGDEGLTLVQLLLDYKAELRADKFGDTPLSLAVKNFEVDILDLFLEMQPMSRQERIDAMELCAALRAPEDMVTVFELLERAMKERYDDPCNILYKPDQVPDPGLGYVLESRSPQELLERKENSAALLIECFAIRKRNAYLEEGGIIASSDQLIYHCLIEGQVEEACLILGNDTNISYSNICYMLHLAWREFASMPVRGNMSLFPALIRYLNICKNHFKNWASTKNDIGYSTHLIDTTFNYLLLCIPLVDAGNNDDWNVLVETTKDINDCLNRHYHPVNKYGLLNAAVRYWKIYRDNRDKTQSKDLIMLLIECGAFLDCRDEHRNTPLHILANSEDAAAYCMARLLLENGADLDLLNAQGRTPAQCAGTEEMKTLLESFPRPLQCLAAHVILEHNLSLDPLPTALKKFVSDHSRGNV